MYPTTPLALAPGRYRLATENTIYTFTIHADGSGIAEGVSKVHEWNTRSFRFVGIEFGMLDGRTQAVFLAECSVDTDPHVYAARGRNCYSSLYTTDVQELDELRS
jgi:hypothetical protein